MKTNEPVAWIIDEKMTDFDDNFIWNTGNYPEWQVKDWIPLYTHQYERPHNTVLVPCDKLAEMQAEIAELKHMNRNWQISENILLLELEKLQHCELTDEEITAIWYEPTLRYDPVAFARAILRKAQEK